MAEPRTVLAATIDQRPTDEILRIAGDIYQEFSRPTAVRAWLRSKTAMCYYGMNQPARNVQLQGLQDAARTWRIPFYRVTLGKEAEFVKVLDYDRVLFITTMEYVPRLVSVMDRCNGLVLLLGGYYDGTPNPTTIRPVTDEEARSLDEHRDRIAVVLSECSPDGVGHYCRGYADKHGLPVMSFTWGINLLRHYPAKTPTVADLVFLGSYFEKTTRIDAHFGEALKRFSYTVIGYGWSLSPFDIPDTMVDNFDAAAPGLYSGHTISLNIHHRYEEEGHTCNERTFNAMACGGFLVCDYAPRIRDFFPEDEIVVADNPSDFLAKVEHFLENPDERLPYMEKARRRLVAEHTYHHRLCELLRFVIDGSSVYEHCHVTPAR
ncbi:MAG: glycosyltransferase [Candidatus Poribacteria bacterium]